MDEAVVIVTLLIGFRHLLTETDCSRGNSVGTVVPYRCCRADILRVKKHFQIAPCLYETRPLCITEM